MEKSNKRNKKKEKEQQQEEEEEEEDAEAALDTIKALLWEVDINFDETLYNSIQDNCRALIRHHYRH